MRVFDKLQKPPKNHTFLTCAKTSISESNLKTTKKTKVQKTAKTRKTHFFELFASKSAVLFVKIRLIIHFRDFTRAWGRGVLGLEK